MRSSLLPTVAAALALLAAAPPTPAGAQDAIAAPRWFAEAGVGFLRVPESGLANVTTGGTAPLLTLRLGRKGGAQLSWSASVAYGEVGGARRDVYVRPSGPTRTETYDYRALIALARAEYAWTVSRTEPFGALEAGWGSDGWRVAEFSDPAGLPPPESTFGGGVSTALGAGLRYFMSENAALGGAVRVITGIAAGGVRTIPEVVFRWRF